MNRSAENGPASRLLPDEPFPPYAFVPGRSPHPESDPAGHSFGRERPTAVQLDPIRWLENKTYLYGLDLLNHGYCWESHVEFESLWLAAGRRGLVADFLKGLIHLAAAGVKHLEGKPRGVKSHARRAAELWQAVSQVWGREQSLFCGFRLTELIDIAQMIHRQGWPEMSPVVFPHRPT